jgi:hypothetical protein
MKYYLSSVYDSVSLPVERHGTQHDVVCVFKKSNSLHICWAFICKFRRITNAITRSQICTGTSIIHGRLGDTIVMQHCCLIEHSGKKTVAARADAGDCFITAIHRLLLYRYLLFVFVQHPLLRIVLGCVLRCICDPLQACFVESSPDANLVFFVSN